MTKFIVLGRVARPHGIKGELRVAFFGDHPELLKGPLFVRHKPGAEKACVVKSLRPQNDQFILAVEGVDNRDKAEALRNAELCMAEENMPPLNDEELYLHQIIGMQVHQAHPPRFLGVLENVLFPAGQELWSIITPEGKEILFPAVPEYVEAINLKTGCISISPPEGLLELYL